MHDLIMSECEVGWRVVMCQENEDIGWSALMDLSYAQWVEDDKNGLHQLSD